MSRHGWANVDTNPRRSKADSRILRVSLDGVLPSNYGITG
jgi:hypothetical protein